MIFIVVIPNCVAGGKSHRAPGHCVDHTFLPYRAPRNRAWTLVTPRPASAPSFLTMTARSPAPAAELPVDGAGFNGFLTAAL
jgi:hypothetical protein